MRGEGVDGDHIAELKRELAAAKKPAERKKIEADSTRRFAELTSAIGEPGGE